MQLIRTKFIAEICSLLFSSSKTRYSLNTICCILYIHTPLSLFSLSLSISNIVLKVFLKKHQRPKSEYDPVDKDKKKRFLRFRMIQIQLQHVLYVMRILVTNFFRVVKIYSAALNQKVLSKRGTAAGGKDKCIPNTEEIRFAKSIKSPEGSFMNFDAGYDR